MKMGSLQMSRKRKKNKLIIDDFRVSGQVRVPAGHCSDLETFELHLEPWLWLNVDEDEDVVNIVRYNCEQNGDEDEDVVGSVCKKIMKILVIEALMTIRLL